MKKFVSRFLKMGFGCVLLWAAASACGQTVPGFYFKADAGGNITPEVDLKEFFGANVSGYDIELDPGFRLGLGGGYQFNDWVAAELELGFMGNEIDSVTGATWIDDAFIGNVPFLINGKLQYPIERTLITPYIGAGVGFSATYFDVDALELRDRNGDIYGFSGSDSDAVFAWQAFAGLRYSLNDRMGLSLEYRYFQADSPSWNAEWSDTPRNELKLGRIQTHAISVAFDFHF